MQYTSSFPVRRALSFFWIIALLCISLIVYVTATHKTALHLLGIRLASLVGKSAEVRSFELRDLPSARTYQDSVFEWIAKYRKDIVAQAGRWRVDPTAIAGVIAYEAIENPIPVQLQAIVRFSGPGKVHYKEFHTMEGDPVARQVETAGYLPRRSVTEREAILRSPKGAITYIAAIMAAFAQISSQHAHPIRCRPALLATFFNGWDLDQARMFFAKQERQRLKPSIVGTWVRRSEGEIRSALGVEGASACRYSG